TKKLCTRILKIKFLHFLPKQFGIVRMSMPLVLGRIIVYANRYFQENAIGNSPNGTVSMEPLWLDNLLHITNRQMVILHSAFLAFLVLLNILIIQPYFMGVHAIGMQIRASLARLIYEKAVRVTTSAVQ